MRRGAGVPPPPPPPVLAGCFHPHLLSVASTFWNLDLAMVLASTRNVGTAGSEPTGMECCRARARRLSTHSLLPRIHVHTRPPACPPLHCTALG